MKKKQLKENIDILVDLLVDQLVYRAFKGELIGVNFGLLPEKQSTKIMHRLNMRMQELAQRMQPAHPAQFVDLTNPSN